MQQHQGRKQKPIWGYSIAGFFLAMLLAVGFWARIDKKGTDRTHDDRADQPQSNPESAAAAQAPVPPGQAASALPPGPQPGAGIVPGRKEDTDGTGTPAH